MYTNMRRGSIYIIIFIFMALMPINAQTFNQNRDQGKDGLFKKECPNNRGEEPGGSGGGGNPGTTPLGSGLLLLTGLAAGYVCIKRSRKEDN